MLFLCGRYEAPGSGEVPGSCEGSKAPGDLLFDFRHADVSLRQVVVEWNIKVMEKSQDILMVVTEALEEIAGYNTSTNLDHYLR